MRLSELQKVLTRWLEPEMFNDYCPNGLQVEGREEVHKVVTGVTACQQLIDRAVEESADAIIVHHGFFWKGEAQPIVGMKRHRIKTLLQHDISLFGYHLPLDAHSEIGNNAQLAKLLGVIITGGLEAGNPRSLGCVGELIEPITPLQLAELLRSKLNRNPQHIAASKTSIKTLAWCTGAAQSLIELAADAGVDAYISGEISEPTVHIARERDIHYYAAGHHATERYGVKALGERLAKECGLDVSFIDVENPV